MCGGGGPAQDHTDLQKAGLRLPLGQTHPEPGVAPAAAGLTYERELVHGDALRSEVLLDAGQPLHVGAPAPAQLVDVLDLRDEAHLVVELALGPPVRGRDHPAHAVFGGDCHSLLQGIFLIQESKPDLLHCRWILYHLSHQESPKYLLNTYVNER